MNQHDEICHQGINPVYSEPARSPPVINFLLRGTGYRSLIRIESELVFLALVVKKWSRSQTSLIEEVSLQLEAEACKKTQYSDEQDAFGSKVYHIGRYELGGSAQLK